jgi:hypothetical protein
LEKTVGHDNRLKKVTDLATILNLLSSAKEQDVEVYLWRLVGGTKHLANVRIEAIRKSQKDFCIVPREGKEKVAQEMVSGQTHLDLFIPDSCLLLRCGIKKTDAPLRYYLYLPEFVAQVERRKSIRLNVLERAEVKLTFSKEVALPRMVKQAFVKGCYDISTGGFSFLVSRTEHKFFGVNDKISNLEICLENWSTRVDAEVASIRELEPDEYNGLTYKVWRIGCRIKKIDQISSKYLEKYIFERIKTDLHVINE